MNAAAADLALRDAIAAWFKAHDPKSLAAIAHLIANLCVTVALGIAMYLANIYAAAVIGR